MAMSNSNPLYPTPAEFLNSLGSSILSGGTTTQRANITNAAGLSDAIASQLLGLGSQGNTSSTTDGLSPLLSDVTDTSALKSAITDALLGGSSSGQSIQSLAALGATLNVMVETAQSALTTTSSTLRAKALSTYQNLYDSLDQSAASIDGAAGNAASLGLSAPGDWSNSDSAAGTAAITADMAAAVKAHTVVQEMIPSVSATLIQSYLLGQ
jgi:hypothetical protein